MTPKEKFRSDLRTLAATLSKEISTKDGQWSVKGFIDAYKNVYTISSDMKIVSKILEIHLFPTLLAFATKNNYALVLAEHQNHYPDVSFVSKDDESIKFAVDFKTTYRQPKKPWLCNGFTLGSFGKYFVERTSTKNIRFPYNSYAGHFCLGIIYDRALEATIDETKAFPIEKLQSITSVISNIEFFVAEKWQIASDKKGSGNTANIGSINRISDIIAGNGMFANLGEKWFDEYWMNFGKINRETTKGKPEPITTLKDYIEFKGGDVSLIVKKNNRK